MGDARSGCIRRIVFIFLMLAVSVFLIGAAPSAAPKGSVSVFYHMDDKPVEGREIYLYKIADENNLEFSYTERFADGSGILDLSDEDAMHKLPVSLWAAIRRGNLEADAVSVTDERGVCRFENLDTGIYLVAGDAWTRGNRSYSIVPALAAIPFTDGDLTLSYGFKLELKHESSVIPDNPEPVRPTPTPETDIDDPDPPTGRPESTPEPVRPPVPEPTPTDEVDIDEPDVPTGEPDLPQTGLLQWPIAFMSGMAVALCIAAIIGRDRKRRAAVLAGIGAVCVMGAGGLALYNSSVDSTAGDISTEVVTQMKSVTVEPSPYYARFIDLDTCEEYEEYVEPTVEIDGVTYIGRIEIPSLGLDLPVAAEWSGANAKIAPCRWVGTERGNDMIIAAHNYKTHFGMISALKAGDRVVFIDADGNEYPYAVLGDPEIIPGKGADMMKAGAGEDWDLTLFTCTYGGKSRVTVRCGRAETEAA